MIKGIDYGFSGPVSGKTIADAGYEFVCRYLSHTPAKNLSSAELADFRKNNLRIVLVYETTIRRCLDGRDAGIEDANYAKQECGSLGLNGMFESPVIYFACDDDFAASDLGDIEDYFDGVTSVLGIAHTGVYGGLKVVQYIQGHSLVQYGWQTSAWSKIEGVLTWHPESQLRQETYNVMLEGVQCDGNVAVADDYGQIS